MSGWRDTLQDWGLAWAGVTDREAELDGEGIRTTDGDGITEHLVAWPGGGAERVVEDVRSRPGAMTTLVADPGEGILDGAAPRGLVPVRRAVLLTAATSELETTSALPGTGGLEEAPLDRYDLVEATEHGRPVASGRVRVENGVAVIGYLKTHHPDTSPAFGEAVLAALVEEAYVHGADTLYTVVSERQVPRYTGTGWTVAAHVITFRTPA